VSVAAFLSELQRHDIRVWMDGDALRCNAPAGALTEQLREQLRERRNDIVSFLRMADAACAQPSALVPLQERGTKPPVFGVPGHSGDVFCYRPLAKALGEDQPFFGLQPPGLDGRSEPLQRVEDLAAHFAAQIRLLYPRGPWIIAGYCSGGTVAFELARQLCAHEESAPFVALFGAPFPTFFRRQNLARAHISNRADRMRRRLRELATQSAAERLGYLAWRFRLAMAAPDPVMRLRAKVQEASLDAVRRYEPRPFRGPVHQFLPSAAWAKPYVGAGQWRSVASRFDMSCGPAGCTHDDMLLETNVLPFAEQFRQSCAAFLREEANA
jgi:thioesterase domain-containing protein